MDVSRGVKCFVVMLAASLVISGVPLKRSNSVRAASVVDHKDDSAPEPKIYRSVEKHSYKVVVKTVSEWAGHANMEICFTNTGKETIHDWYFTFDYDYAIENPSNCYIVEHKDNLYTIANNNWNQDIAPGKSVKISFTAASSDGGSITKNPSFYLLNTKTVSLTEKELSYKYEEYSDWGSGFSGALVLTNASNDSIRDWTISFGANRPLTHADSASLKIKSDSSYTICNDGNNQNISKGKTYRIGIQGGYHDSAIPFELTGYTVTAKKLAIKLSEDKNKNGIADVRETDYSGAVTITPTPSATITPTSSPVPTATSTPVPTSTNTPTPTNAPTSTPTTVPTVTTVPTGMPSVTPTLTPSPEPTMTNTPEPTGNPTPTAMPTKEPNSIDRNPDYTDTDSDGLPDELEEYYGTDKNKPDTDDDGVNDNCELLLGSDPKTPSNIGNGDRDADGLSNATESRIGTNPASNDSDFDGLSDGEEVNNYGTDPTKYDTDDDGINDYNEIKLGSNPKVSDSGIKRYQSKTLKITNNTELNGVTEVVVSGNISGSMVENTKIKDIYGKDLQSSSITALVGNPVSIETTGEFSSMTITFKYSDDLNENNLRIMWFDEENCEYVVLTDYTINTSRNTISVTSNHFSKYMLIDEEVWVKTWTSSMRETKFTNSLKGYFSFSDYVADYKRMTDSDHDGIPDYIETNGMITNVGSIIYTDPKNPDSDGDGLSDGYEMGELCLTEDIFARSNIFNYIDMWYAEHGYRQGEFVYFRMRSNPNEEDSDKDGSNDSIDLSVNSANDEINYILYYKNPAITGLKGNKEEYCLRFLALNMEFECFEINSNEEFSSFWKHMCHTCNDFHNVKDDNFSSKIKYSRVRNLVIIFHGYDNGDGFDFGHTPVGEKNYIEENDIGSLAIYHTNCVIEHVDIQACYSYRDYDGDRTTVATAIATSKKIHNVYASNGALYYNHIANYNFTKGDGCSIYRLYKDANGKIQNEDIGPKANLLFWEGKI